jgi:1,4-dihydroxy-6-naphthoate synthase
MPFIASLARELDSATLEQHIAAYVNGFSLDMGPDGRAALNMLQTFRDLS